MGNTEQIIDLFEQNRPMFTALGDPIRQQLLITMLRGEKLSVQELTAQTNLSRPAVSHHLKILKEAGIVTMHKQGRQVFYAPYPSQYFDSVKELLRKIEEKMEECA